MDSLIAASLVIGRADAVGPWAVSCSEIALVKTYFMEMTTNAGGTIIVTAEIIIGMVGGQCMTKFTGAFLPAVLTRYHTVGIGKGMGVTLGKAGLGAFLAS